MKDGTVLKWWTGCRMRELIASHRENLVALHDKETHRLVALQYEADVDRAVKRGVLVEVSN